MRLHDIFGMARPWTIVYGGQKMELAQKIMQVEVDVKCMCTKFMGMASLALEILLLFVFLQISLSDHGQKIESAHKTQLC